MSRVDIHVHTNKSDGAGSVKDVLKEAANQPELLAIAITDHNEISGALEATRKASKFGIKVIVGEEISTSDGHILGLFLKEKIERGLSPEEVVNAIHRQGGLAIVPHPFPHYRGLGSALLERLLANPDKNTHPDGVEVRNGFPPQLVFHPQIKRSNQKKWYLAEVGGSDSHHPRSLGSCWTEFDGDSLEDFRQALTGRKTWSAGSGWGVLETARAVTIDAGKHLKRRFRD